MHKKNEAILITAGTRRIGLCLAKALLQDGYHCILHYRSSADEASEWLHENPSYAECVTFIRQELSDNPEHLIDQAVQCGIPLTGLINNASIFTRGSLDDYSGFEKLLSIHLMIPQRLGSRFASLPEARWIINITDARIRPLNRTYQNYRMSKLFLEELTRQQAFLYAPQIRVNAIAPGAILPATGETEESFARLQDKIPLHRTGDIDALIQALHYLISSESTTGQTLAVDGGCHLIA